MKTKTKEQEKQELIAILNHLVLSLSSDSTYLIERSVDVTTPVIEDDFHDGDFPKLKHSGDVIVNLKIHYHQYQ